VINSQLSERAAIVKKLVIIANPVAGRGRAYRRLQRFVARWPHSDWRVELLPTCGPEDAGRLALALSPEPPDVLAVAGGDGTMNEIASSLPDPPFPIALLPAGTANLLALELKLPLDPVAALETALSGVLRRVDVGALHGRSERRFLLMAGIGFDAYVAARVNPALKQRIGIAAYYVALLQSFASYPFPEFEIHVDGFSATAVCCIVANAASYGGGLLLTPGADMGDGLLEVLALERAPKLDYLSFLLSAWRRKPKRFPWVRRFRARRIELAGASDALVQVDGEPIGPLPVTIDLLPSAFLLLAPSAGQVGVSPRPSA
jgi:YegS/Rv2252/BmrU family lipid kinase